jgi:hypothetical protein
MLHRESTAANNHIVHSWSVATPADRDALVVTSADIGRVAQVITPSQFWVLSSITPSVWLPFANVPGSQGVAGPTGPAGAPGANASVLKTFAATDLVAGVYTAVHNLNSRFCTVSVYNNLGVLTPVPVTAVDANTMTLNLSAFGTLTGSWNARFIS